MIQQKRIRRGTSRSRNAAAAVEFALIAPLMITFTFGMIELGRLMMVKNVATQASREGARVASLPHCTPQAVMDRVLTELELHQLNAAEIEISPSNLSSLSSGALVEVRVSIDPASVSWVPNFFSFTVPPIVAQTSMRREGSQ